MNEDLESNKKKKVLYVNGLVASQQKKVAKFVFGHRFIDFVVDDEKKDFIVLVRASKEEDDLTLEKDYKKEFGVVFRHV